MNKINIKNKYTKYIIILCSFTLCCCITLLIKTAITNNLNQLDNINKENIENEINILKEKNIDMQKQNEELDKKIIEYKKSLENNDSGVIQKEIQELKRKAGYTDVTGYGLKIVLKDEINNKISSNDLLQVVKKCWNSGAKAISINNERIINTTEIVEINNGTIVINAEKQKSPYIIQVIGDNEKIEKSLYEKNGYINDMIKTGKNINITHENVVILKYKGEIKYEYGK